MAETILIVAEAGIDSQLSMVEAAHEVFGVNTVTSNEDGTRAVISIDPMSGEDWSADRASSEVAAKMSGEDSLTEQIKSQLTATEM